jgi:fatty-acyl-CoA synthase
MSDGRDFITAALARLTREDRGARAVIPQPRAEDGGIHLGEARRFELVDAAEELAEALAELGVGAGERIAWIGYNDVAQLILAAACARLGCVLLPLNWRLSVEELRWIEQDAGYRVLMAPIGEARATAEVFEHPYIADFRQRRGAEPGVHIADPLSPISMLPEGPVPPRPVVPPEAPLLLCYTSGTTGRPKGALLTQTAVAANLRHAQALFGFTPADRVLTVLPLFHVGGLCIQTLPALLSGAQVLLHRRFDPDWFFDALERDKPTLTLLVPAVMQALVSHPRWADADLSCLRAVGAGSSDVPVPLIEAFHAKGVPVQQVYGATETGPIAIAQSVAEAWAAPGSIGRPVPGVEARLSPAGEILVRGPNTLRHYWPATPALDEDGWFATGDVGRIDEHGRWWFTDRLKHVIISGGENIYPAEVERVLCTAPGVAEGAVCGRADGRWGEVPVAVVVPGPGFSAEAVLAHFQGRLARFKHPHAVMAVPALPRTALGKVELAALRRLARA